MSACPPSSSSWSSRDWSWRCRPARARARELQAGCVAGADVQGRHRQVSRPATGTPGVTLYDQYDNPGAFSTNSQNYEAAFNAYDDEAADDFVIPGGLGWNIDTVEVGGEYFNGPGPATSVSVNFYTNDAANLPGTLLQSRPNMAFTNGPSFSIPLSPVVSLGSGTYWVSVQANQTYNTTGQWGWRDRTVTSNAGSAWRNPSGGFQPPLCTSWGRRGRPPCNIDLRFTRPGLQAPGHDGSAATSASATTAASASTTAAAGSDLQRRRRSRSPTRAPATPYPSNCVVSGLTRDDHRRQPLDQRLSHTYTDDVDIMLARPDAGDERNRDVGRRRRERTSSAATSCSTTRPPTSCRTRPRSRSGSWRPANYAAGATTASRPRPRPSRRTSTCPPSTALAAERDLDALGASTTPALDMGIDHQLVACDHDDGAATAATTATAASATATATTATTAATAATAAAAATAASAAASATSGSLPRAAGDRAQARHTRGSGSAGPTAPSAASAAFAPGDRCAAASSGRARGPAPSGVAASRSTCWSAGANRLDKRTSGGPPPSRSPRCRSCHVSASL